MPPFLDGTQRRDHSEKVLLMPRHTIFPNLRACTLRRCLDVLVAECNRRNGPHRPQVGPLKVLVADSASLPAWIDLSAFSPKALATCQIFQIVEREATLTVRTPEPLLWLIDRPLAAPPAEVVQACARHGHGRCCGKCRGDVMVYVFQSPLFPLTEDEVNYQLAAGCGCKDHAWCRLPRWGQQMSEALQALLAAPTPPPLPVVEPTAAAAGASSRFVLVAGKPRKRPGAPCLSANLRLERTIEKLPDIYAFHHLEQPWLKWHRAETGEDLAAPKRSFATAALRCIARIERRRASRGD
jgi:hypothetical protein